MLVAPRYATPHAVRPVLHATPHAAFHAQCRGRRRPLPASGTAQPTAERRHCQPALCCLPAARNGFHGIPPRARVGPPSTYRPTSVVHEPLQDLLHLVCTPRALPARTAPHLLYMNRCRTCSTWLAVRVAVNSTAHTMSAARSTLLHVSYWLFPARYRSRSFCSMQTVNSTTSTMATCARAVPRVWVSRASPARRRVGPAACWRPAQGSAQGLGFAGESRPQACGASSVLAACAGQCPGTQAACEPNPQGGSNPQASAWHSCAGAAQHSPL
jgi:hypothetical protein